MRSALRVIVHYITKALPDISSEGRAELTAAVHAIDKEHQDLAKRVATLEDLILNAKLSRIDAGIASLKATAAELEARLAALS